MKKILLLLILSFASLCFSQEGNKALYLKGNALTAPLGVLNAGVEYQLNSNYTLQGDVLISPWKSFLGSYAQLYMAGAEGRYYFDQAFRGWYAGVNISTMRYIAQKWNYWGDGPYQLTPDSPVYITSDLYQDGYSLMVGATVGYQLPLTARWNLDLFLGGGMSQSIYKGYHKSLGIRFDEMEGWNKSGEWMPYRGGIMVSYKLK